MVGRGRGSLGAGGGLVCLRTVVGRWDAVEVDARR